jgi:hypothetical protein
MLSAKSTKTLSRISLMHGIEGRLRARETDVPSTKGGSEQIDGAFHRKTKIAILGLPKK